MEELSHAAAGESVSFKTWYMYMYLTDLVDYLLVMGQAPHRNVFGEPNKLYFHGHNFGVSSKNTLSGAVIMVAILNYSN